jgi:hypothetical protein
MTTRDYLLLECGHDPEVRNRVLDLQKLLCSTSLEKIKIQFSCRPAELAVHDGQEVFKTALPRELMRLQRREYYRMGTPANTPVKCTITTRRGDKAVRPRFRPARHQLRRYCGRHAAGAVLRPSSARFTRPSSICPARIRCGRRSRRAMRS